MLPCDRHQACTQAHQGIGRLTMPIPYAVSDYEERVFLGKPGTQLRALVGVFRFRSEEQARQA
ncbi:hypothetical protein D3C78_1633070 [compost metagenome]